MFMKASPLRSLPVPLSAQSEYGMEWLLNVSGTYCCRHWSRRCPWNMAVEGKRHIGLITNYAGCYSVEGTEPKTSLLRISSHITWSNYTNTIIVSSGQVVGVICDRHVTSQKRCVEDGMLYSRRSSITVVQSICFLITSDRERVKLDHTASIGV